MATNFTPTDAVQAIARLTSVLETIAQDLRTLTVRSERYARWQFWLLALVLFTTVGIFVLGARSQAIQSEALSLIMQENRAIFQRLNR